jgi:phosphoenolpyruvate-protein kinase (PTS system EI component)
MKEYTCEIKLHFVGNNREANSVEEYKQLIIDQYQEEYGIELDENEIENIQESEEENDMKQEDTWTK